MNNNVIGVIQSETYAVDQSVTGHDVDNLARTAFKKEFAGKRYLNDSVRLAILASDRLNALDYRTGIGESDIGLCVATFGSHFEHAVHQYVEIKNNDRPLVSPMLGPNNTPNAIAGQLAVYHKTRAFAVTFCDSGTAGLDAFLFGINSLRQNKSKRVLVLGTEFRNERIEKELFDDPQARGVGSSVALLLENGNSPKGVPSNVLNYEGHSRSFIDKLDESRIQSGLTSCIKQALKRSGGASDSIDVVLSCVPDDMIGPELTAIKHSTGQEHGYYYVPDQGCSGELQSIAILNKIHHATRIIQEDRLSESDLWSGRRSKNSGTMKRILINQVSNDGTIGCLLLSSRGGHA